MPRRERPPLAGKGKDIFFFFFNLQLQYRGGSRGRVQGMRTMWFIGDEVEQETSAPLLKKILDPPLQYDIHVFSRDTYPTRKQIIHALGVGFET